MTISLVLAIVALICFVLAAIEVPSRINLTALGLAFLTLTWLVDALSR